MIGVVELSGVFYLSEMSMTPRITGKVWNFSKLDISNAERNGFWRRWRLVQAFQEEGTSLPYTDNGILPPRHKQLDAIPENNESKNK
jgi:hypothetical protein